MKARRRPSGLQAGPPSLPFEDVMRRGGVRPWLVFGGSALFCLTLWATHPLTSADIFNYITSARIFWVHGENPLVVPPLAYPDDPFFRLLTFWQGIPSPYGPLWSLIAGVPVLAGGDDPRRTVLAFKAVSILFFLATGALLYMTAVRIRPDSGVPALLVWQLEDQRVVAGHREPCVLQQLLVELAGFPSRVAERDGGGRRALAPGHRREHVARGGHVQRVRDGHRGLPGARAGAMQHEAAIRAHGPAVEHRARRCRLAGVEPEMAQHFAQCQIVLRPIDDDAHRVFGVVLAHHDDGAVEAGIADPRHRHQ